MISASAVCTLYPKPRNASTIALALGGALRLLKWGGVMSALRFEHPELLHWLLQCFASTLPALENPGHDVCNLDCQQGGDRIADLVKLLGSVP
ncbi:hypothetical protein D3C79_954300 [compost metagenome]